MASMSAFGGPVGEIKEGFLCPICMQDLGTVIQLQEHFEQQHSNEDKQVLHQLKGLFERAKDKLTKPERGLDGKQERDISPTEEESTHRPTTELVVFGGIDPALWDPQEVGATRNHTDVFKSSRDGRLDRFVVETNKLIIRLDKLIGPDCPTEPTKRKAYEKKCVPWVSDQDVKVCPNCGREFGVVRRRHHCRLCGGVMCNHCSNFLPFLLARKLVNPAFAHQLKEAAAAGGSPSKTVAHPRIRRSDSAGSLNSILSTDGEPHIRICCECRKLVDRRDHQMEQRQNKPAVLMLYEKMLSSMSEADRLCPAYVKLSDSLNSGDTVYELKDAQSLRVKILSLFETIDLMSKKISVHGLKSENAPGPKQAQLQRRVRQFATDFLQEKMLSMQALPTHEKLKQMQEERKADARERVARERRAALEAQQRATLTELPRLSTTSPTGSERSSGGDSTGFLPHTASVQGQMSGSTGGATGAASDNPVLQQMDIIRGYIQQAKQAWKLDEVSMLEANLKELQAEYRRQQKGMPETY